MPSSSDLSSLYVVRSSSARHNNSAAVAGLIPRAAIHLATGRGRRPAPGRLPPQPRPVDSSALFIEIKPYSSISKRNSYIFTISTTEQLALGRQAFKASAFDKKDNQP